MNQNQQRDYSRHLADGDRFRLNNQFQNALNSYRLCLQITQNFNNMKRTSACVEYEIGSILLKQGSNQQAFAAFRRSIQLNPQHSVSQYNLGRIYSTNNMFQESERAFLKSIQFGPLFQYAYIQLSALYERHGLLDKALAINKQLVKKYPAIILKRNQDLVKRLRKNHLNVSQVRIIFQNQSQFETYLKDLHISQQQKNEQIRNLNDRLEQLQNTNHRIHDQIQAQFDEDQTHYSFSSEQEQRRNEEFEL